MIGKYANNVPLTFMLAQNLGNRAFGNRAFAGVFSKTEVILDQVGTKPI